MTALAEITRKWRLEELSLHFKSVRGKVFFATRQGQPVALKIAAPESWTKNGHTALMHFAGKGGVRMLGHWNDAILMERIAPGNPLSDLVYEGNDDLATQIVCEVADRLHGAGPGEGFPPIPQWHDRYDRLKDHFSVGQYARAKKLYKELAAGQSQPTLIHGDLHHDNILKSDAHGWAAIDPKGWFGEPAYEFGCMLRNPGTEPRQYADAKIIDRRVSIITEHTGLNRQRLLLWAYSSAVLSAIWDLEDSQDPTRGLTTAQALEALL